MPQDNFEFTPRQFQNALPKDGCSSKFSSLPSKENDSSRALTDLGAASFLGKKMQHDSIDSRKEHETSTSLEDILRDMATNDTSFGMSSPNDFGLPFLNNHNDLDVSSPKKPNSRSGGKKHHRRNPSFDQLNISLAKNNKAPRIPRRSTEPELDNDRDSKGKEHNTTTTSLEDIFQKLATIDSTPDVIASTTLPSCKHNSADDFVRDTAKSCSSPGNNNNNNKIAMHMSRLLDGIVVVGANNKQSTTPTTVTTQTSQDYDAADLSSFDSFLAVLNRDGKFDGCKKKPIAGGKKHHRRNPSFDQLNLSLAKKNDAPKIPQRSMEPDLHSSSSPSLASNNHARNDQQDVSTKNHPLASQKGDNYTFSPAATDCLSSDFLLSLRESQNSSLEDSMVQFKTFSQTCNFDETTNTTTTKSTDSLLVQQRDDDNHKYIEQPRVPSILSSSKSDRSNIGTKRTKDRTAKASRTVQFDNVHIRTYEQIFWENNDRVGCRPSISIGIGWNYKSEESIDVEVFEHMQSSQRRHGSQLLRIPRRCRRQN